MYTKVSLDRVLQFVSPQVFEAFEHSCFKAEEAIEKARHEAEAEVSLARRKRGRPRKVVRTSDSSSAGSEEESSVKSALSDEAVAPISGTIATDRRGRPRPTYSHFYLKQRRRHGEAEQRESRGFEKGKQPVGK